MTPVPDRDISSSHATVSARRQIQWVLAVIAGAIVIAVLLFLTRPVLEPHDIERAPLAVRWQEVQPRDVHLSVHSQGTVQPRTEAELIPEVSGRVTWLAPSMVSGGRFREGELLLRIDDSDYRNNLGSAEAAQKRAAADAQFARFENERLGTLSRRDLASRSQAENAERALRVAESVLQEAEVAVTRARLDLQRTEIAAPFSGRVRTEQVDVGQFIARGSSIATLYATDYGEVRLPVADRQLAFLDPALLAGTVGPDAPPVLLRAHFGGRDRQWHGRIVRTEGEIDMRSRMVHVVARIENPEYDSGEPLPVGLFVSAEIRGQLARGVIELPRAALRDGNRVLVIDAQDTLRFRDVELLRMEHDKVLLSAGLEAGERVCVSALQAAVDGMPVVPIDED